MPFGVVGAAIGIAGGLFGGAKAARGARRLEGAENAVRRIQAARERGAQIRGAAQAIGEQVVGAAGSGAESSSAVTGRFTLLNQLQSNLTFINQTEGLGRKVDAANRLIGRGQKIADVSSGVGSFIGAFG
jgi:hypothetical protein